MAYGIELHNRHGSELLVGIEQTYVFWGRQRIYMRDLTHSYQRFSLFNIPSSWNPQIFHTYNIFGNNGILHGYIFAKQNGRLFVEFGVYEAGAGANDYVDIYVFVPCKYVPKSDWGMEIYNDNNELGLSLTRPLMRVQGVNYKDLSPDGFAFPTPYKVAAQGTHFYFIQVTTQLISTFYMGLNNNGTHAVSYGGYVTNRVLPVDFIAQGYMFHFLSYINTEMYDHIPSLPYYEG